MSQQLKVTVIKPGVYTSVQDGGREQYRAFGVPKSGPMDQASARAANLLVGNPEHHPVLEYTFQGPLLELAGSGTVALTGAPFKVTLDDQQVQLNTSLSLEGSHSLRIQGTSWGCRGYLAIAGDWNIDPWLDSCSTAPQAPAQLTPGSLITAGSEILVYGPGTSNVLPSAPSTDSNMHQIEILAGPEYPLFTVETIKEFLGREFQVSVQSNRMGYRLDAPFSNYQSPIEVISSGVVPGTIQVTHSGQLIVLMADAQTTGGYPRIANVISKDLDKLGQMKPGDRFKFKLVSLEEAYQAMEL